MKCKVCSREVVKNGYCDLHAEAYKSVVNGYEAWKKALGISWEEYLSEIAKNPLTGEWAKEVAEHLIKSGEREVGTSS
ncbi:MAG: hypothetical protein RMJ15_00215 [Nitrososphaerota archaeon]|nr:hypothetical protein [Candidatus Bathyarchaeota archaeon]MDW8022160.1 hypothetical protein [Nitrososphaerota archaeon]